MKKITLYKCGLANDYINEDRNSRCTCRHRIIRYLNEEVSVCRNYFVELLEAERDKIYDEGYSGDVYEVLWQIRKEAVGPFICSSFDKACSKRKDIIKLRHNGEGFIDKYSTEKGVSTPRIYLPFTEHNLMVSFHISDVLLWAVRIGLEAANDELTDYCWQGFRIENKFYREPIRHIVQLSVQNAVRYLEDNNIKFRKKKVEPILKKIKSFQSSWEEYDVDATMAIAALLQAISSGALEASSGTPDFKVNLSFFGI